MLDILKDIGAQVQTNKDGTINVTAPLAPSVLEQLRALGVQAGAVRRAEVSGLAPWHYSRIVFALILASADKQPVTVGALAFVTASGIQYGQIAAAIIISITPTLALALYAQRYLVEGLSMGAVKG